MTMTLRRFWPILALSVTPLIAGCAATSSSDNMGTQIASEGQQLVSTGKQWEKGQATIHKGDTALVAARKSSEEGHAMLRRGEELIVEGNSTIKLARNQYAERVRRIGTAASADGVRRDIEALKAVEDLWRTGTKKIEKGNNMISEGRSQIQKAESSMQQAQATIAQGRSLVQGAEDAYETYRTPTAGEAPGGDL